MVLCLLTLHWSVGVCRLLWYVWQFVYERVCFGLAVIQARAIGGAAFTGADGAARLFDGDAHIGSTSVVSA